MRKSGRPAARVAQSGNAADGKFVGGRRRGDRAQGDRDGKTRRYGGHSPVHGPAVAAAKGRAGRFRLAAAPKTNRRRRGGGGGRGSGRGGGTPPPGGPRAPPRG